MTEFDPTPPPEAVDEVRDRWRAEADTFDRIYDVVLGLGDPTAYTEIADLADCSPNAAKKHLERLADIGVVRADRESRPARYARNDGYLEWQEANRIAEELTVEEIIDRVRELEERRSAYEAQFDATDPASVSVFDLADHDAVHERMVAIGEWQGIDRDIRLYELARRLAENDGRLVSA